MSFILYCAILQICVHWGYTHTIHAMRLFLRAITSTYGAYYSVKGFIHKAKDTPRAIQHRSYQPISVIPPGAPHSSVQPAFEPDQGVTLQRKPEPARHDHFYTSVFPVLTVPDTRSLTSTGMGIALITGSAILRVSSFRFPRLVSAANTWEPKHPPPKSKQYSHNYVFLATRCTTRYYVCVIPPPYFTVIGYRERCQVGLTNAR